MAENTRPADHAHKPGCPTSAGSDMQVQVEVGAVHRHVGDRVAVRVGGGEQGGVVVTDFVDCDYGLGVELGLERERDWGGRDGEVVFIAAVGATGVDFER